MSGRGSTAASYDIEASARPLDQPVEDPDIDELPARPSKRRRIDAALATQAPWSPQDYEAMTIAERGRQLMRSLAPRLPTGTVLPYQIAQWASERPTCPYWTNQGQRCASSFTYRPPARRAGMPAGREPEPRSCLQYCSQECPQWAGRLFGLVPAAGVEETKGDTKGQQLQLQLPTVVRLEARQPGHLATDHPVFTVPVDAIRISLRCHGIGGTWTWHHGTGLWSGATATAAAADFCAAMAQLWTIARPRTAEELQTLRKQFIRSSHFFGALSPMAELSKWEDQQTQCHRLSFSVTIDLDRAFRPETVIRHSPRPPFRGAPARLSGWQWSFPELPGGRYFQPNSKWQLHSKDWWANPTLVFEIDHVRLDSARADQERSGAW